MIVYVLLSTSSGQYWLFPDRFVGAVWEQPSIDVTPLLFAGALYLLSKVFQYGQELQTLSDETL